MPVEYDNSFNDFIELVRSEFEKNFPAQMSEGGYEYRFVTDVFKEHLVCRQGKKYYEVDFEKRGDDITFAEQKDWRTVKLSYVQEMMTGSFHDIMIISEFKGSFPDIPVFKDVNIKELTQGEKDPVFVTLPIGMANVKSGNNRYYDEAFLTEMEKQVQANKPIGLMGHLSSEERSFAFPAEAVHWVGTRRVKEYLLGKGYIPEGEPRARLQRYRATKKKIATSIDATADGVWDSKLEAYKMLSETLVLNQIDIAPADRAGISDLSAVPLLTTEMLEEAKKELVYIVKNPNQGNSNGNGNSKNIEYHTTEGTKMGEDAKTVQELKPSDISLLPEDVRAAIIQEYSKEIKTALGISEGNVVEELKKIRERDEQRERQAISNRIKEVSSTGDKAIKIDLVREMVVELVEARNPKNVEEVDKIYGEILEKESVKKALEMNLQDKMGPPQTTPIPGQKAAAAKDSKMKGTWFVLPEAREQ